MSSIQFNYFADVQGELIIREEILRAFRELRISDYFGQRISVIDRVSDFVSLGGGRTLLIDAEGRVIVKGSNKHVSVYENPIMEYMPSMIREGNVYVEGRIAYFAGYAFPEFRKKVQALFRKLKKCCWWDKYWRYWVFESIGNEATVFIPNRLEHVSRFREAEG